ncbi:MAG: hypothetical protein A2043_04460 [Candidatus Schekmanbacteria bacterium GWA2_38_9]|uniref:Uncharacterized protein n=1 Tax=Candidatus Schekmanbacteria bacterium RIFCSPLOWO2_12_FULL_38_15 TaxID=1817883 RepID=A0A1F7SGY8_9BACT|nr:MAG: hypothetical protein A2043_04460 [Candidatus Schekmanbacteria bacterium GWA2_38_9]OGL49709.1 MAG: hypothetical protein A3H37_01620 [Candidatus Schekmanbacteria bacterium RIFCSPLOWO2_02_FULL_38_14]OGL53063.1 MAG: hypothetical protein A3G31_09175 [Candidatus Schekmanbacteria bacterium RIFCSPLOWO2_12_FULL_38_15]
MKIKNKETIEAIIERTIAIPPSKGIGLSCTVMWFGFLTILNLKETSLIKGVAIRQKMIEEAKIYILNNSIL